VLFNHSIVTLIQLAINMRLSSLVLFAVAASSTQAFAPSSLVPSRPAASTWARVITDKPSAAVLFATDGNDNEDSNNESSTEMMPHKPAAAASKVALLSALTWAATAQTSLADSPDWGIFEGRTLSLAHPFMMASLLVYSLYTAFLGFQWRRQRTLGDEISALKKSLPVPDVPAALAAAQEAGDAAEIAKLEAASSTVAEIAALTQERKDLAAKGPRDQHYAQGALLAFLGTAFAIEVRVTAVVCKC